MDDEPTPTVKPKSIIRGRVLVQYIDELGRVVTICPPAYAEGAERRDTALPKGYLDLGDE